MVKYVGMEQTPSKGASVIYVHFPSDLDVNVKIVVNHLAYVENHLLVYAIFVKVNRAV